MGFPTDVRLNMAYQRRGLNQGWGDEGTQLGNGQTQDIVNVTGKAGELLDCRLFSKHADVQLVITIDGELANGNYRETPGYFVNGYGCALRATLISVVRYDTVNDKYVYELTRPIPFGNSLRVELRNYTGSPRKCAGDALWMENT